MKEVKNYVKGKLHGENKLYTDQGMLVHSLNYYFDIPIDLVVNDIRSSEGIYYSGTLTNGNGKLESKTYVEDLEEEIVFLERNFKDSVLHGSIIGIHINGNPSFKGQYLNGYMMGSWEFYDYNGELNEVKEYVYNQFLNNDSTESRTEDYNDIPFIVVNTMPRIGDEEDNYLQRIISKNVMYPEICRENGIQGKVYVSFTINRIGEVIDIEIAREADPTLNNEAARVVKLSPYWVPGFQNGTPVNVRYTVPINFKLG